jgi:tetratricopeptide (TPR) repeat protein
MKDAISRQKTQKTQKGEERGFSFFLASFVTLCGQSALCLSLLLAAVLCCCSVADADVVAVKDRPPLVSTQVLRLADGKLVCKGESAGEVLSPIEKVEYMQITGWQMFNLAEKQRRTGEWHRAIASYERALADLQDAEPTFDRKLLVKCRLIQACDAQARFTRALELYLEVVEQMPATVEALRPTRMPETGSEWLTDAVQKMDAAIARHPADEVGKSLSAWKATWPRPVSSAPESATTMPVSSQSDPRVRAELASIATMVTSGQFDEALSHIAAAQGWVTGTPRAELYYWQGRALELAILSSGPVAPPATQPASTRPAVDPATARAGLAYMRVVAHFPAHPLAAESLFRAADLCRRSGRIEQARTLWSELIAQYPQAKGPDGTVWADKARQESK